MAEKSENKPDTGEENLNELLDSCLDDFNKPIPQTTTQTPEPTKTASNPLDGISLDGAAWSEEFKEFGEVLENCLANGPDMEEMCKLVGDCFSGGGIPADGDAFMKSFAENIQQMTQQAQNIPETSPDDLLSMLGNLSLGDSSNVGMDAMPEIMPIMQSVMQKLMSKEMLYPPIKEVVEKYPAWLDEKKSSHSVEEHERYNKQFELMKQICTEFEKEVDSSEAAQKEQFEKVLQLMQKVQTYGNPPKELVANIGPGLPLDDQGNLQIPGVPDQCSIM